MTCGLIGCTHLHLLQISLGKACLYRTIHQKAFDDMKKLMTKDVLLSYPDHNLPYNIYTDASNYQLGAVIFQKNTLVTYYSCKLSAIQ